MKQEKINKVEVIKKIIKYNLLKLINNINLYDKIKKYFNHQVVIQRETKTEKSINVQLHGAFLIFTPNFIDKMENAFCPETFLYLEEIILKKICDSNNFITLYDPHIQVLHKEDSSTNVFCGNTKEKRKFVFTNMINSYFVLLKYL